MTREVKFTISQLLSVAKESKLIDNGKSEKSKQKCEEKLPNDSEAAKNVQPMDNPVYDGYNVKVLKQLHNPVYEANENMVPTCTTSATTTNSSNHSNSFQDESHIYDLPITRKEKEEITHTYEELSLKCEKNPLKSDTHHSHTKSKDNKVKGNKTPQAKITSDEFTSAASCKQPMTSQGEKTAQVRKQPMMPPVKKTANNLTEVSLHYAVSTLNTPQVTGVVEPLSHAYATLEPPTEAKEEMKAKKKLSEFPCSVQDDISPQVSETETQKESYNHAYAILENPTENGKVTEAHDMISTEKESLNHAYATLEAPEGETDTHSEVSCLVQEDNQLNDHAYAILEKPEEVTGKGRRLIRAQNLKVHFVDQDSPASNADTSEDH